LKQAGRISSAGKNGAVEPVATFAPTQKKDYEPDLICELQPRV